MTLEKSSDFVPLPGEACFPPPIEVEVVGGLHIAPECITRKGLTFYMIDWPNGLPRHETHRTVRFPHGLMRFGEGVLQCAERLVRDQLGAKVVRADVIRLDSYLDDKQHWHLEPILLVEIDGEPKPHGEARGVVTFEGYTLPGGSVWGADSFRNLFEAKIVGQV